MLWTDSVLLKSRLFKRPLSLWSGTDHYRSGTSFFAIPSHAVPEQKNRNNIFLPNLIWYNALEVIVTFLQEFNGNWGTRREQKVFAECLEKVFALHLFFLFSYILWANWLLLCNDFHPNLITFCVKIGTSKEEKSLKSNFNQEKCFFP